MRFLSQSTKRSLHKALLAMGLMATPMALYAQEKPAAPAAPPAVEEPAVEEPNNLIPWKLQSVLGDQNPLNLKLYGHIDQGVTVNPDDPDDRLNFGRLFDDRSNDYRLNQVLLTLERPLEPEEGQFGWGFKTQFMYGTDARFVHYIGEMDNMVDDSVQLDLVEAFGNFHFPVLFDGGVDLKVGQFVTLMGAEVIDAKGNPLYSHTYSFNFGIPFKHTGFLATAHVTDWLHLHAGLVTGQNTGIDDNNDVVSFHGGVSTTFFDGKLSNFTSVHSGGENDESAGDDVSSDARTIVSSVTTIQLMDGLKSMTDLNYGQDDGFDAEWYGVAQYFIFDINKYLAFVLRGEVFRDDDAFAVFKDPENDGVMNAQIGEANSLVFGSDTTYYALTAGLNIKPFDDVLIRPEVRWDWADGGTPYDDSSSDDQFTFGIDVILSF